jgi:hypothetical protein
MNTSLPLINFSLAGALCCAALSLLNPGPAHAGEAEDGMTVYYLGNSLTRNVPLERLAVLFESAGFDYDYGMQLGGGHRLELHLVMRNHGNAPGEGTYNTREPYGYYPDAFQNQTFDAVVLQPYKDELDKEHETMKRWPYHDSGTLQAADALIDQARGVTEEGEGRWDLENPVDHQAAKNFFIYATWPPAGEALEAGGFSEFWQKPYEGGVAFNRDFFAQLIEKLNERQDDLETPVRLIPTGHVLAALDTRIREGNLPGIAEFYEHNQPYYMKSRRNNKGSAPFDPEEFQPEAGVLNFYADGIHMNDQPHNGKDSGAIGSYVSALTIYSTLTGRSPVGLTAEPYEQFDAARDQELIRALQQTVWDVVRENPHTGVE